MATTEDDPFQLPKLRASFGLENDTRFLETDDDVAEFFDVKFCPFQPLEHDPVFAAVSKKHVRLDPLPAALRNSGESNPAEVLRIIRDDDDEASACCCTWSKDPVTGSPLICVGGVDAKVKIYDAALGVLKQTFVGHGGDVNDLVTSPANPFIVASASDDTSIRIWSLDVTHTEQPCLCILAGKGHTWGLLSVAFHDSGKYLLSAGHDQVINLWTIPELPTEATESPVEVHYPHFSTSAIHGGIVDCVAFYGDNILSRSCHDNLIVMWRIEGFCSTDPVHDVVAPTGYEDHTRFTRSAFVPSFTPDCASQYTRLLEFHTPKCGPQFFMRFSLFHAPDKNPVLAFCNTFGNIFFWDFKRLQVYHDLMATLKDPNRDKSQTMQLPNWLKPIFPRQRADASGNVKSKLLNRDAIIAAQIEQGEFSAETMESWQTKYSMDNPDEPLRAHRTESTSTNVVGRQAAWSPGGEWCVVVGSSNTTLILQRWSKQSGKTSALD